MSMNALAAPLMSRRKLLLILGGTALAGCVSTLPDMPAPEAGQAFAGGHVPRVKTAGTWWQSFRDPQLDSLLTQALARNLDVKQAVAAIREVEAEAAITGAASLPTLEASGAATRAQPDGLPIRNSTSATMSSSWIVDLFGGQRSAHEGAAATLDAAYLSADVARLTVASAVASSYIDLRFYQESIALNRRNVASRREALELTSSRAELGDADRLEVIQAEQAVAQAEAQLPALEVEFDKALNHLATLTARRTADLSAGLRRGAAQPRARFKASVGIPAEVLRARPDIGVAEKQFIVAAARVGVAAAALYPSLTLSGTVTPLNMSGVGSSKTWSFGPQLNLPIFTGGANKARLRASEAQAVKAHIAWQSAVLNAVEEVENALAAYRRDSRNIQAQSRLVSSSQEMLTIARESYSLGESNFIAVLDAQRELSVAQQALAQAMHKAALTHVLLSVAAASS